jgi:hypothetical protein
MDYGIVKETKMKGSGWEGDKNEGEWIFMGLGRRQ